MFRELAVIIYLLVFRFFFNIFSICPQKNKSTFVASFGDNVLFTLRELEKHTDDQVVVLKTGQSRVDFKIHPNRLVLDFEPRHLFEWIRSIYHLATSKTIFIDNYFGFLAEVRFKPNVKCIQLWHAAGAIKQFGLMTPSSQKRSPKAIKRFKQVYSRFDYVVAGSEKMADIFCKSFEIGDEKILRTGIPRTDFFYDENSMKATADALRKKYPVISDKKVILYAPTFRDDELSVSAFALDIEKMYKKLKDDYVLFLRTHPAVRLHFANNYPDFTIDLTDYPDVNELLTVTDLLITDYSSIPFEFSLLQKPMIFFPYDLEEYSQIRGFYEPYEQLVPGPIVKNTDELLDIILNSKFDMTKVVEFAHEWNEYSTGTASQRLVQEIYINNKSIAAAKNG